MPLFQGSKFVFSPDSQGTRARFACSFTRALLSRAFGVGLIPFWLAARPDELTRVRGFSFPTVKRKSPKFSFQVSSSYIVRWNFISIATFEFCASQLPYVAGLLILVFHWTVAEQNGGVGMDERPKDRFRRSPASTLESKIQVGFESQDSPGSGAGCRCLVGILQCPERDLSGPQDLPLFPRNWVNLERVTNHR